MVLYTYLLLLLWQPVLSADLCQDGLGACDAGDLEVALEEDVSEETLKLLQTKQVPGMIGGAGGIDEAVTEAAEDTASINKMVTEGINQQIEASDAIDEAESMIPSIPSTGAGSYNTWDDRQHEPHYEHHDRHEYHHHYDDHHHDHRYHREDHH